jgi:alpha-L-rhamnosidase
MNSFNHYSFGAVGEWMYATVVGIDLDEQAPGYAHILIRPHPGGTLTSASGKLETIHGTVSSAWTVSGCTFTLAVTVPVNTTPTVTLPYIKNVLEGGKPVAAPIMTGADGAYTVGSGNYTFTAATQ